MTQLFCSRKDCSPLAPFTGAKLETVTIPDRLYVDGQMVETTMRCLDCKRHFVYKDKNHPLRCALCDGVLVQAMRRIRRCTKCGTIY